MAQKSILKLRKDLIKHLCCFTCKQYLSSVPIYTLPDGSNNCSKCYRLNNSVVMYRNLVLETALSNVLFPCRFRKDDCQELLCFGEVEGHELQCIYRIITCPFSEQEHCTWSGPYLQIRNHFKEKHLHLTYQNFKFKLLLTEAIKFTCLMFKDDVPFVITGYYKPSLSDFSYDVKFFDDAFLMIDNVSYIIQMVNASNVSSVVEFNSVPCLEYNNTSNTYSHIFLNQFEEIINDTSFIIFQFVFTITLKTKAVGTNIVDYKLLDIIRCSKCQRYLVPPLFDIENETICSKCARFSPESVPSTSSRIKRLVDIANYPCRWYNCNFVGNCDNIKRHEVNCKFVLLKCFIQECNQFLKVADFVEHFSNEHCVDLYISSNITYDITFTEDSSYRLILSYVNGKLFLIVRTTVKEGNASDRYHCVLIYSAKSYRTVATLNLAHDHCKLYSNTYLVDVVRMIKFTITDLPPCFKLDHKLKATLDLKEINR